MDIIIKSFNRPYCLDRCIQSIYKFVVDSDFKITVLDDGTPQIYLDKIQEKFPKVVILKSSYYKSKVDFIEEKSAIFQNTIPIDFWVESISKCSDYFLLLEDDIWFTAPFNLSEVEELIHKDKIQMLKLFWLSNPSLIVKKYLNKNSHFSFSRYNLFTLNRYVYQFLFRFYRFKTRKIFKFLGIYSLERELNYYTIYSVAGAIFNKKYFLNLWNKHNSKVDEGLQIRNALNFLKNNPTIENFGNSNIEVLKTSFLSSASNGLRNQNFDMFAFNAIINQAWLNNDFEVMQNFPNDFLETQIEVILDRENNVLATKLAWKKWVLQFKNQYRNIGCQIQ